jgi:hypothetical protein
MGTDIHIRIEVKENDKWERIPYISSCGDEFDAHYDTQEELKVFSFDNFIAMPSCFNGRYYHLFAVLADVRNGRGFGSSEISDPWPTPISPRGIPEDISFPETEDKWYELEHYTSNKGTEYDVFCGEHNFSWITLEELKNFPWDRVRRYEKAVIPYEYWIKWKEDESERPRLYCHDAFGPHVRILEINEIEPFIFSGNFEVLRAWIETQLKKSFDSIYIRDKWLSSVREATYNWPGLIIPLLEDIAQARSLRLLISFDS